MSVVANGPKNGSRKPKVVLTTVSTASGLAHALLVDGHRLLEQSTSRARAGRATRTPANSRRRSGGRSASRSQESYGSTQSDPESTTSSSVCAHPWAGWSCTEVPSLPGRSDTRASPPRSASSRDRAPPPAPSSPPAVSSAVDLAPAYPAADGGTRSLRVRRGRGGSPWRRSPARAGCAGPRRRRRASSARRKS